jgi:hypothetical protein
MDKNFLEWCKENHKIPDTTRNAIWLAACNWQRHKISLDMQEIVEADIRKRDYDSQG